MRVCAQLREVVGDYRQGGVGRGPAARGFSNRRAIASGRLLNWGELVLAALRIDASLPNS